MKDMMVQETVQYSFEMRTTSQESLRTRRRELYTKKKVINAGLSDSDFFFSSLQR